MSIAYRSNLPHPKSENIPEFMASLEAHRSRLTEEHWQAMVEGDSHLREWRYFLLNDSYTRWGYVKPRGYAGDAVLMDFAYRHHSVGEFVATAGSLGQTIYDYTSQAAQSLSAVSRSQFISQFIEEHAGNALRIASIASGHGREYEYLTASALSKIDSVLAIDSDSKSLDTLRSTSLRGVHVDAINRNIFRTRLEDHGPRDFVYSLGLFDYLNADAAARVLENMCACVSPGGTVCVANLHQQAANLGYCEAIMDWWMVPRNEEDLLSLSRRILSVDKSWEVSTERLGCFCYLKLTLTHQQTQAASAYRPSL